jgi:hypothetical protein
MLVLLVLPFSVWYAAQEVQQTRYIQLAQDRVKSVLLGNSVWQRLPRVVVAILDTPPIRSVNLQLRRVVLATLVSFLRVQFNSVSPAHWVTP